MGNQRLNKGENNIGQMITKEIFIERLKNKFTMEQDNIEIIEYTGTKNPLTYKCKKCGMVTTIKAADTLLKRHSNIYCRFCYDPNAERKQQKQLIEKINTYLKNSPSCKLIDYYQKDCGGNRRRLCIKFLCTKCNSINEIYAANIANDHLTCKCCERIFDKNFEHWFNTALSDNFEIIDPNEIRNNRIHIRCKKCNFIFYPSKTTLKRKNIILCPKCKGSLSKGELYISNWLIKNNINFQFQQHFSWLPAGFRYDFFIPEMKLLIEYDGSQHREYVPHFHKTEENFLKAVERDKIKEELALSNGFNIIRIPDTYNKSLSIILKNLFSSTTIPNGSRGKRFEIDNFLPQEKDIV